MEDRTSPATGGNARDLRPAARPSLLEPLIAAFVGLLLVSNVVSQKFMGFAAFGINMNLDSGTLLLFPLTYIFSDVLTEVYGYAASRRVVWYGFAMNAVAALVYMAAVALPHSPDFTSQEAFAMVLGQVPGLVVASMAGYLCGSFTNDFILARMKMWMVKWDPSHRWLPLRTIVSTVGGEFVDTLLFVAVATLFGVFPAGLLVSLVITQWIVKSLVEAAFTPLTVLVVRFFKKREGLDIVGTETWNPFALGSGGGKNLAE